MVCDLYLVIRDFIVTQTKQQRIQKRLASLFHFGYTFLYFFSNIQSR